MPDAMDIWRAGAPRIDLFAADIYSPDFVGFCAKYTQSGNPLFIPETAVGEMRSPGALRLRTPRRDRLLAVWHRQDRRLPSTDLIRGYDLLYATGAPDSGTPGQRHDVRRPAGPERPAPEDPGGELHAGGRVNEAPRPAWSTTAAAAPCPSRRRFSSPRGRTSTTRLATA